MSWKSNPANIGDKRGSLTVVEVWGHGHTGSPAMVKVQCVCGTTKDLKVVRFYERLSCGCGLTPKAIERNKRLVSRTERFYRARKVSKAEGAARSCFQYIRRAANKRGHVWKLTFEEFHILSLSNCFYCGDPPSQLYRVGGNQKQSVGTKDTGGIAEFYRNGIDRMDNEQGYTLENSVSCCKVCNFMKNTMPVDGFYHHIDKIQKFRELQKIQQ
jgi:hypothetical protein